MSQIETQVSQQDQEIRAAMLEMAKSEGISEEQFDTMRAALAKGASIADVLGISSEAMESAYALAYNHYKAGNYQDAETVFRGLCLYDGNDARFWMGLAACLQARGDYTHAIDTYGMAGAMSGLQDPDPLFYGGVCYLKLGDTENALVSFQAALGLGSDDNPAHKACHDKIRALLATLDEGKAS